MYYSDAENALTRQDHSNVKIIRLMEYPTTTGTPETGSVFLMESIIFTMISITDMNLQNFLQFILFIIKKKK